MKALVDPKGLRVEVPGICSVQVAVLPRPVWADCSEMLVRVTDLRPADQRKYTGWDVLGYISGLSPVGVDSYGNQFIDTADTYFSRYIFIGRVLSPRVEAQHAIEMLTMEIVATIDAHAYLDAHPYLRAKESTYAADDESEEARQAYLNYLGNLNIEGMHLRDMQNCYLAEHVFPHWQSIFA